MTDAKVEVICFEMKEDTTLNYGDTDDINKAFEQLLLAEEQATSAGRDTAIGDQDHDQPDQTQGQTFGYYHGANLGAEIGCFFCSKSFIIIFTNNQTTKTYNFLNLSGYYMGVVCACITFSNDNIEYQSPKVKKLIVSIKEQIDNFRSTNRPDVDFEKSLTSIRNNFQHLCSLLKVKNFKYPQLNKTGMDFCEYTLTP